MEACPEKTTPRIVRTLAALGRKSQPQIFDPSLLSSSDGLGCGHSRLLGSELLESHGRSGSGHKMAWGLGCLGSRPCEKGPGFRIHFRVQGPNTEVLVPSVSTVKIIPGPSELGGLGGELGVEEVQDGKLQQSQKILSHVCSVTWQQNARGSRSGSGSSKDLLPKEKSGPICTSNHRILHQNATTKEPRSVENRKMLLAKCPWSSALGGFAEASACKRTISALAFDSSCPQRFGSLRFRL